MEEAIVRAKEPLVFSFEAHPRCDERACGLRECRRGSAYRIEQVWNGTCGIAGICSVSGDPVVEGKLLADVARSRQSGKASSRAGSTGRGSDVRGNLIERNGAAVGGTVPLGDRSYPCLRCSTGQGHGDRCRST